MTRVPHQLWRRAMTLATALLLTQAVSGVTPVGAAPGVAHGVAPGPVTGRTVRVAGPAGPPVPNSTVPVHVGSRTTAPSALTYEDCAAGGPTSTDAALAAQLSPYVHTDRMDGMDSGQMSCARAIVQAVQHDDLPERAGVLALMTAMAESTLHDYLGGDLDSVGLFQQRASQGWGTVAEEEDTVDSTKMFLDRMVADYPDNAWQTGDQGAICQSVQISSEPTEYDKQAAAAQAVADVLFQATSSTSAVLESNEYHVFGVSPGGALFQDTHYSAWTGWQDLAGSSYGSPAVTYHSGRFDVFALSPSNGAVYQKTYDHGWGAWHSLGGVLSGGIGVGAVYESGQYHVFGISPGGALYQDTWNGTWSGWQNLGGRITGTPAVTFHDGRFDVFAAARTSRAVFQKTFDGGWGPWSSIGGNLGQGGLGAVYENGEYHVFGISPGGVLFQNTWSGAWNGSSWAGSRWQGWQDLGGRVEGTPGVTYYRGRFDVFAIATADAAMDQITYVGRWGPWSSLGGRFAPYRSGR